MQKILADLRAELNASIDEKSLSSAQKFFKEKITLYGVKTQIVSKIAQKYWKEVKTLPKKEIFALSEELLGSDFMEEAFVVSSWLPNLIDQLDPKDILTFKVWIEKYINNWAKCDSFCNHTIGELINKYPETVIEVKSWAHSDCRWLKRASAVSLIIPAKKGKFLQDAFEISDSLLLDQDDLVQKSYGWLLKEESRTHAKEVFDYVVRNRKVMPRTALRYAIELMSKDFKAEAMKKD
jgi:3-methyladenine DNA glycosylase AlkD